MRITNHKTFKGYGVPSTLIGEIGDLYYDVTNVLFYEKKPDLTWWVIPQQVVNGLICGDGTDGDVIVTVSGSISRDMYYNNLTVNLGARLDTAGFKIFVKGTLTLNGSIVHIGANAVLHTGGASAAAGSIMSAAVAAGPDGTVNAGSAGAAGASGFGGSGGAGGLGVAGAGGAGGTVVAPAAANGGLYRFKYVGQATSLLQLVGAVAASGGGGGGNSPGTDKGGGGGGAGGFIWIAAGTVVMGPSGSALAYGGAGGAGAAAGCGGGGGGGGGIIIGISNTPLSVAMTHSVAGGAGGAAGGVGGAAGVAGSIGQTYFIQL